MSKHYENVDARLASIDRNLAVITEVIVSLAGAGSSERVLEALSGVSQPTASPDGKGGEHPAYPIEDAKFIVTPEGVKAGKWMTSKQASGRLCIVKSTLDRRLQAGVLTRFHKKGDEYLERPRVWLSREQVEAYYRDYTLFKGKEK